MKTHVNKSEQHVPLNFIAIVSVLTFAGILFFVSGKTVFDSSFSPATKQFNYDNGNNLFMLEPEDEQPKETRINPAEFAYLKTMEASPMVVAAQKLEENKLNVFIDGNDQIVNELILTTATMNSTGNFSETESLLSGKGCNLGWKTAKGIECFFCRCNEYLASLAERKNQLILFEIDMEWQMNNFLAVETEMPLTLETWMTDEKCWCPEQRFDFNNFELLAKASEK